TASRAGRFACVRGAMRGLCSAWPLWLAGAAGAIALQLALALPAEAGVRPAALAAARVAVLAGALAALADAGVAMVRGDAGACGNLQHRGQGVGPWHVVAATAIVLGLLLWRYPSRLVLNEVGFVLTA